MMRADVPTLPLRVVQELGLAFSYERSFKLSAGSAFWQRYVLAVDKTDLPPPTRDRLLQRLGFPARWRAALETAWPDANLLGLGYERGRHGATIKLYLEFWDKIVSEVRASPADLRPRPMFLGFKWDEADPERGRVTRYDCHPRLPVERILGHIRTRLTTPAPLGVVEDWVRLAASRGPSAAFKYLDVHEDGGDRASFDLNLYSGELRLHELRPGMLALARHFDVDARALAAQLDTVGNGVLGHVSAGRSGDAGEFFSVYFEPPSG
jgi:hypothetical protein